MQIKVTHSIGELATDMADIPPRAKADMAKCVRRNVTQGNALARRLARQAAGPHGTNYYKRISSEMLGPLSGEYGPTGEVAGNAVGAGWRHGRNTDLERSLDVQGPKFARDVGSLADNWFW